MASVAMRAARMTRWLVAVGMGAALASCSGEGWKWDWWNNEPASPKQKPVTQSQTPSNDQRTAKKEASAKTPAKQDAPKDQQSDELQAKVDRYVRAMSGGEDRSRDYNDFNSKMERQKDPNRKSQVRKVAERGQDESAVNVASPSENPTGKAKRPSEGSGAMSAEPSPGRAMEARPAEPTKKPEREPSPAGKDLEPKSDALVESEPLSRTSEEPDDSEKTAVVNEGKPFETPPAAEPGERADAAEKETTVDEPEKKPGEDEAKPAGAARPPILAEVTVAPAPEASVSTPPAEETKAGANLPEQTKPSPNVPPGPAQPVDTFQSRLAAQEAVVAKDPDNVSEQYKLRMMYLADGQDDKALAPAKGLDAEANQILQAQVRAFISARASSGRDPAARATDMLEPIDELRDQLRSKADLRVPRVILCSKIEAFGMYEPIDPPQFAAGRKNPVLVYIEVDNFKSEKTASGFHRTLLSVRPSLLNKAGEELWSANYENIEDLSRQRRQDFFLTVNEALPPSLAPGEYTLKMEVEDVLAGKINSNTAKFKIVP